MRLPGQAIRLLRLGCCAAVALAALTSRGASAQTMVDLQLILAVDASGSVNTDRFELQRKGYVAAFRDKQVLDAVRGSGHQSIAVAMFQWTGPALQAQIVPWTLVKDQASAETVASLMATTPRRLFGGGTSISGAIDYSMKWFPQSPFKAEHRVIDISGDGSNNAGRSVTRARDEAVTAGVVINGLPVMDDMANGYFPDLDKYYAGCVTG